MPNLLLVSMPDCAYGTLEVTGTKDHVMAFSRHFLYKEDALMCRLHLSDKLFYKSIIDRKLPEFEEDLICRFEGVAPDKEKTIIFRVEFDWSSFDFIQKLGLYEDCIDLKEACVVDRVDVKLWTEKNNSGFCEAASCNRRGELSYESRRLKHGRCPSCGEVTEIFAFQNPVECHCGQCGGVGFEIVEEDE